MRVFRDVEMVESLGSGMQRIMRIYKRDNFEFGDNFIRFKVYFSDKVNALENVTENVLENNLQLTERQLNILKRLCDTGQMDVIENVLENVLETSLSLAEVFDVNERTIRRDLFVLQQQGYIRHDGSDKGGRWIVLKKV